jgi:hypothetical protein
MLLGMTKFDLTVPVENATPRRAPTATRSGGSKRTPERDLGRAAGELDANGAASAKANGNALLMGRWRRWDRVTSTKTAAVPVQFAPPTCPVARKAVSDARLVEIVRHRFVRAQIVRVMVLVDEHLDARGVDVLIAVRDGRQGGAVGRKIADGGVGEHDGRPIGVMEDHGSTEGVEPRGAAGGRGIARDVELVALGSELVGVFEHARRDPFLDDLSARASVGASP